MKKTSRHFSLVQKQDMVERDGPLCWFKCGRMAQDADHAVRLSAALPHLNEIWNGHLLCRPCHEAVTNPNTMVKWKKALALIQDALHKAYTIFTQQEYARYYQYYKSKLARYYQLYGKDKSV